ncbi:hypothetical protein AAG570_011293 [Ranatra chinensis]|uniref:Uncharacterized protein n=1 Tax=Ranatra chinensis TaxID=642074 RepID=A0ABD0YKF9_9HEMI
MTSSSAGSSGTISVVLVQGYYLSFLPLCSRNEPVFLATCTPVAMPETRECVVQGATNVFTTIHSMDMKFVHIDKNQSSNPNGCFQTSRFPAGTYNALESKTNRWPHGRAVELLFSSVRCPLQDEILKGDYVGV